VVVVDVDVVDVDGDVGDVNVNGDVGDVNGDVNAWSNASTITRTGPNEEGRPPLGRRPSR
jgi:hypothetical protein